MNAADLKGLSNKPGRVTQGGVFDGWAISKGTRSGTWRARRDGRTVVANSARELKDILTTPGGVPAWMQHTDGF